MADSGGYALPVGHEIDDFRIIEVLGQGGFGITYKALDVRLERAVAIKEYLPRQFAYRGDDSTVLPRAGEDRELFDWGLKRFIDEARALAMFRHPNIIAVMRYLESHGTACLVMEYEEGEDLEQWLARHPEGIAERVLVDRILLPLLDGLEKVHQKGLLHRDIKPDNVFIRRDGTPVLIDFGASRAHGAGATMNMTSLVSAGYSPFEQYGGAGHQGPWSDLYALAGTLYRVVAGHRPADAIVRQQGGVLTPAVEVGKGRYSAGFLSVIDRALALDPAQRPQSAGEFRDLLSGGAPAAGESYRDATQVRRVPAKRAAGDARSRRSLWWSLGGVGAVMVAAGLLFVTQPQWRERLPAPFGPGAATEPAADAEVGDEARDAPSEETGADEPDATGLQPVPAPGQATDEAPAEEPAPTPGEETSTLPAGPAALDEDAIFAGLAVPDAVRDFRGTQIAGALLAYITNKTQFDTCRESGCADLTALMSRVQEALQGYEWEQPPLSGTIRVVNPKRLENEECPFLIDVEETISLAGVERRQKRTYCTRNGYDRSLQSAGEIEG